MKTTTYILSLLASLAMPAFAERVESIALYDGTPTSVKWVKNNTGNNDTSHYENNTWASIHFNGVGDPLLSTETGNFTTNWQLPVFDTMGGTRIVTGMSLRIAGHLDATFNANSEGRNRNIEGYIREASLKAEIGGTVNEYYNYKAEYGSYEAKDIPVIEQTTDATWDVNTEINDEGFIVRSFASHEFTSKESNAYLQEVTTGGGYVNLVGFASWNPFYSETVQYQGTTQTLPIDCGTDWTIPAEISNQTSNTGPIDEFGRNLEYILGTELYPSTNPHDYIGNIVANRVGAASPLKIEVLFYYTQAGDADFGKSPYAIAGKYILDFGTLDNAGFQNKHPQIGYASWEANHGDLLIQEGEWQQGFYPPENYCGDLNKNFSFNIYVAHRAFLWTDANQDNRIDADEFIIWRTFVEVAKKQGLDPVALIPGVKKMNPDQSYDMEENDSWVRGDSIVTQTLAKLKKITLESKIFNVIDTNHDNKVTRSEWMKIYLTPSKKETLFGKLDANHNGTLSITELVLGRKLKSAVLKTRLNRMKEYFQLNVDNYNKKITRKEILQMWNPGTAANKIDAVWKKIGGKDINQLLWLKLEQLPTYKAYLQAVKIRAIRQQAAYTYGSIHEGNYGLSRTQFGLLFKAGTSTNTIDNAWLTATNTLPGKTPPTSLPDFAFIECVLNDATIR